MLGSGEARQGIEAHLDMMIARVEAVVQAHVMAFAGCALVKIRAARERTPWTPSLVLTAFLVLAGGVFNHSAATGPDPAARDSQSCADLVTAHPGAPCSFDFTRFRPTDPRLATIEAKGIDGSGLFGGRIHSVRNAKELNALGGAVRPGDQVVLADGNWRDAVIGLHAEGTPSNPIVIRPQTPGGVTLTGQSAARFWGSHLLVYGLAFAQGTVDRGLLVFALGLADDKPCDDCIADRIVIDGYNSTPAGYDTIKVHYMSLRGRNITVANSTFSNKRNIGTMILAALPRVDASCPQRIESPGECFQRLLFLNNRVSGFSGNPFARPDKEHKVLQLGASNVVTRSAFAILEGNVFEHASGENSLITMKASDVIIRRNLFRSNEGTLNLRHVNRVLLENNVFDGAGKDSMGGIRVEGRGHWIVHNLFKALVKPMNQYYWPIAIHTAAAEEARDEGEDYARVKDLVIADNLFQDTTVPPIAMGIFPDPARGRTLQPRNVFLLDNVFAFSKPRQLAPGIPSDPGPIYFIGDRSQFSGVVERGNRFSQ